MSKALHKRFNHSRKSTDKKMSEVGAKVPKHAVLVRW